MASVEQFFAKKVFLVPSTVTLDDIPSDDEVGSLWNIPLEWSILYSIHFSFQCAYFSRTF